MNTEITENSSGWVLYDGECHLCRQSVALTYRALRRRGFLFATLQAPWVRARLGLKENVPLLEMRLLTPDGRDFGGADAVAQIARTIWWAWPLYLFSRLPGGHGLLAAAYRELARRRNCADQACAISHATGKPSPDKSITSAFYELP